MTLSRDRFVARISSFADSSFAYPTPAVPHLLFVRIFCMLRQRLFAVISPIGPATIFNGISHSNTNYNISRQYHSPHGCHHQRCIQARSCPQPSPLTCHRNACKQSEPNIGSTCDTQCLRHSLPVSSSVILPPTSSVLCTCLRISLK